MAGLGLLPLALACDDGAGRSGTLPSVSAARMAAPDFTLVDQNGDPFALADVRGKAVVMDFIFTHCPGPCPILTGINVSLQRSLPPELRAATHFVSITIDPERDSPEALGDYARARGADLSDWSFLGGPVAQVESVTRSYGVASMSEPGGEMNHQLVTVLIDPEGRIAEHYLGVDHEADEIRRDLESLIP